MFNVARDICSITDFKRNTGPILDRVIKEKAPAVLTLNGSSSVVVVDVNTYQQLIENAEQVAVLKSIERGIQDVKEGRYTPAEEVFKKMRSMAKAKANV